MWLLQAGTPPDPLGGIGTAALVTALCAAVVGLWLWLRSEIKGRREDAARHAIEMQELLKQTLTVQVQNVAVLERVVRRLDDARDGRT